MNFATPEDLFDHCNYPNIEPVAGNYGADELKGVTKAIELRSFVECIIGHIGTKSNRRYLVS